MCWKVKHSLLVREDFLESEDEMTFAFLDTLILLDEVTTAENWTDNSGCFQCISNSNGIQFLDDGKQSPSETL